jgi:hypothetical protein
MPIVVRNITTALIAAAVSVAAAGFVPSVTADADDDDDPHIPDMAQDYCPGGTDGGPPGQFGFCDGIPYGDGSYWHTLQWPIPINGRPSGMLSPTMKCVVGRGPETHPAPPGGCDGAV